MLCDRKLQMLCLLFPQDMGYCVVASYEFETDGSVDVILDSILRSTTQVVAVFADPDRYIPEMIRLKEKVRNRPDVIFISNRYWNTDRMGLTNIPSVTNSVVTKSLSFRLADSNVDAFVTYLNGLTLSASDNPWLPEYYQVCYRFCFVLLGPWFKGKFRFLCIHNCKQ